MKPLRSPPAAPFASASEQHRVRRQHTPNQSSSTSSGVQRVRTSHACDRCRLMRTKCSGGARCVKCTKDESICVYGDRKRERNKKDLVESLDRVGLLERDNMKLANALRSMADRPGIAPDDHSDILEVLSRYSEHETRGARRSNSRSQSMGTPSAKLQSTTEDGPSFNPWEKGAGEAEAGSDVGSPSKQGVLADVVNLDQGAGASGYIGKMSEISWIQRAFQQLRGQSDGVGEGGTHPTMTPAFSYFLDDTNLLAIDEDFVDPYYWPTSETALVLSEAYFHAVQGAFPFVVRERFLQEAFMFPGKGGTPSWEHRRWLALANLVWAIGAKWLGIAKLEDSNSPGTHHLYYARARALGLDHRVVFDHPDMETVQAIGLLAFYLLINGSITRAWNTLGNATRHATALGLHLRVSDPKVNELGIEDRARTWYSLYSLEVLFAEITGRPKSIFMSDVTIPIEVFKKIPPATAAGSAGFDNVPHGASRKAWLEFLSAARDISYGMTGGALPWKSFASVGQNISPHYFPHRLHLCQLSDKIATRLYRGSTDDSWADIQRKIGDLQTELRSWADDLPPELAIQGRGSVFNDPRIQIELSMYYHSLEMILHRPCLCEVVIENQSIRSQEFNRSSARACVHAAMSMLAVMPDNPTAHEACQLLPWWALLHFVAQATAVLLLELCLEWQHFPNEAPELVTHLRKAMAYLSCMAEGSFSAYRAWKIFRQLLSEVSEKYEALDLVGISDEAPKPSGWEDRHEAAVLGSVV